MEILQKIIAAIMSILMAIATFLGIIPKQDEEKAVRNVILLIGDGMGAIHLEKTKQERNISLAMDTMPVSGRSMTYSATDSVTDSAAGATALACGVKTYNHAVGYYWFDAPDCNKEVGSHPKNITELCMENGMKTGVVTTDVTSGATPAGFSAHTSERYNTEDICEQQLASGIDLIWGGDEDYITPETAAAAGYTYISTIDEMNALTGEEKSFGQFTSSTYHLYNKNEYTPTLSQMAECAVNILNTDNENGFFLMIEGAHIDKRASKNDDEGTTEALAEFDNAVKAALEFAEKDGHTLVVVTADHETGGIVLNDGEYTFTTTSHTGANVPIRVFGPYEFIKDDEVIENTAIPVRIAAALEFPENSIPFEVKAKE